MNGWFDLFAWISVGGLAGVWVLYPATIGLLARLRSRRPAAPAAGGACDVSVVLASREPVPVVMDRIRDLLHTRHPLNCLQIVVAHDGSTSAPEVGSVAREARIDWVPVDPPGGKAAALNAGVRACTGRIVVFADSYQRFEPEAIPNLVRGVLHDGVGAATGNYDLSPDARGAVAIYWKVEKWLRRSEARVHSSIGATGAIYAIRRDLWKPLPAGLILDDVYTPMRIVLAGHRVDFVESARAVELRSPSPGREFERKVRTLTGVVQLTHWLPALLVPWRNPVWLQFVCHKLLRLLTPYWAMYLALWGVFVMFTLAPRLALLGFGAAALCVVWSRWARRSWFDRLRHMILEGLMVQAAVMVAGVNGLRRNWRVWDV